MNVSDLIKKIESTNRLSSLDIFESKERIYSFINPYSYHLFRKNSNKYLAMDGLFVDGIFMCMIINFLFHLKIKRKSFDETSMAKDLLEYSNNAGKSIYFIGAKENEIENAIKVYKKTYRNIKFVGYRNGYFVNKEEYFESVYDIINLNPDYIIVGMGAIKQENFLLELKNKGYRGIGFTCGGFIHQSSNGAKYYPSWINKYNLRAFYRLYKEKHTRKRLYNVIIEFPLLFFKDFIKTKYNV